MTLMTLVRESWPTHMITPHGGGGGTSRPPEDTAHSWMRTCWFTSMKDVETKWLGNDGSGFQASVFLNAKNELFPTLWFLRSPRPEKRRFRNPVSCFWGNAHFTEATFKYAKWISDAIIQIVNVRKTPTDFFSSQLLAYFRCKVVGFLLKLFG